MRVAPIGWAFEDFQKMTESADESARPTHNHPEGLKEACAIAGVIWAARRQPPLRVLAAVFSQMFGYDLEVTSSRLKNGEVLASTCQDAVPAAAIACLSSKSFEESVRTAVSFGGDTDTTACIAGAIAEAMYGGVSREIEDEVRNRLDKPMLRVFDDFTRRYCKAKLTLSIVPV